MKKVEFTRMDQGSREEFELLLAHERGEAADLPERVLDLLRTLDHGDTPYRVNRYEHSLQAATRALRDGAEEELVVCALLHDVGDLCAPKNHGEFAASILSPYVSPENAWIVRHHGDFQGYHYFHHWGRDRQAREKHRSSPYFDSALRFCESFDQISFDPDYDTLPLKTFVPMVARVLGR